MYQRYGTGYRHSIRIKAILHSASKLLDSSRSNLFDGYIVTWPWMVMHAPDEASDIPDTSSSKKHDTDMQFE